MKVQIKVVFKTPKPISQQEGMELWSIGYHFKSLPGPSTYQLKSRGESDSLEEAEAAIKTMVAERISQDPDFVLVEAKAA